MRLCGSRNAFGTNDIYASAAQRGGQPPGYYADRVTSGTRLDRDVEAKKRLIARMKLLQM
jgi:hypothetical protein